MAVAMPHPSRTPNNHLTLLHYTSPHWVSCTYAGERGPSYVGKYLSLQWWGSVQVVGKRRMSFLGPGFLGQMSIQRKAEESITP